MALSSVLLLFICDKHYQGLFQSTYSAVAFYARIHFWRPRIIQNKFSNTYVIHAEFFLEFTLFQTFRTISNSHKMRTHYTHLVFPGLFPNHAFLFINNAGTTSGSVYTSFIRYSATIFPVIEKKIQAVLLLTCIKEVSGLNLGRY
jgi:hypothetical protein